MPIMKGIFRGKGFFKNASRLIFWRAQMVDESVQNTGVIGNNNIQNVHIGANNVNNILVGDNNIMKYLAEHTIRGVEHDCSERDPPPQCHPGTRLDICRRAQSCFHDPSLNTKLLWVHGPAGVGKSAIMQTLAQEESNSSSSILGATAFFSKTRKRNDTRRLFNTIGYQLAVRYRPYRSYVIDILTEDPKIVEKSMAEQFKWFIIKPFIELDLFRGCHGPVLIILDGLDECNGTAAQRELVTLIGRFALDHPESPLIWATASRPEPHIVNALDTLPQTSPNILKIEVEIDSDKARADMELFLRARFEDIRRRYALSTPWPLEVDFLKVAKAASGHFIFGEVVIRFVDDEDYGNPVAQLKAVIDAIEATPSMILRTNPLAILDRLYAQIISPVPSDVKPITMRLLSLSFADDTTAAHLHYFWAICNWLQLSQADAYGALRKLHSVLHIPPVGDVDDDTFLRPFHKSFSDYILSPTRSGKFHVADPLKIVLAGAVRVLCESHDLLECTVNVSTVKLSWLHGSQEEMQTQLLSKSFDAVVNNIDKAISCENDPWHISSQLSAFFADIDYGEFTNLGGSTMASRFKFKQSAEIFTILSKWGLSEQISIQSIELDYVRSDQAIDANSSGRSWLEPSTIPRTFADSRTPWKNFPLCHFPDWRDQVQDHLAAAKELEQPARVYMIGKGEKSVIGIYQHLDAKEW